MVEKYMDYATEKVHFFMLTVGTLLYGLHHCIYILLRTVKRDIMAGKNEAAVSPQHLENFLHMPFHILRRPVGNHPGVVHAAIHSQLAVVLLLKQLEIIKIILQRIDRMDSHFYQLIQDTHHTAVRMEQYEFTCFPCLPDSFREIVKYKFFDHGQRIHQSRGGSDVILEIDRSNRQLDHNHGRQAILHEVLHR